jgi:hypothetical protein
VEAQALRFGGGLYVRRLSERATSAIVSLLTPPDRGGGVFLPSHNKIHDTQTFSVRGWVYE